MDGALEDLLPKEEGPAKEVLKAMRYSVFAGGKRVRPILCLAASDAVGGDHGNVLPLACAIECIHTYSLIHDDLPAMDDDDFRRGVPTCHKVFGEALAILTGDALLTLAFHIMSDTSYCSRKQRTRQIEAAHVVVDAAGVNGMIGGQVVDIASEGREVGASVVEYIHEHKTAALLTASITAGALMAGGKKSKIKALTEYGKALGVAFQVVDDILDIEGDQKEMGKTPGADLKKGKATYPSVYGLEHSKDRARNLIEASIRSLKQFGPEADPLRLIASYILNRKK